jgi:hypothetical protein
MGIVLHCGRSANNGGTFFSAVTRVAYEFRARRRGHLLEKTTERSGTRDPLILDLNFHDGLFWLRVFVVIGPSWIWPMMVMKEGFGRTVAGWNIQRR